MATITPTIDTTYPGLPRIIWAGVSTADTMVSWKVLNQHGLAAAVQVTGTFGGATVTMTGSNDDTNFVTLKDNTDTDISVTTAGLREFSTAVGFLKPASAGGGADNVDVILILRG